MIQYHTYKSLPWRLIPQLFCNLRLGSADQYIEKVTESFPTNKSNRAVGTVTGLGVVRRADDSGCQSVRPFVRLIRLSALVKMSISL